MEELDPTIIAFAVAGAVGLMTLLVFASLTASAQTRHMKGRIGRATGKAAAASRTKQNSTEEEVDIRLYRESTSLLERLAVKFVPSPTALRERLSKTGKDVSPGQYALWCLIAGLFVTALRMALVDVAGILALLIAIIGGIGVPHIVVNSLIKRRLKAFTEKFPNAIELIVRGLKSGLPVTESIRTVGEEFDGPVGAEFKIISDRIKLGQTLDVALWDAVKRIDLPDFKFFVISIAIQRETGGNLTETLNNLVDILRKRRQMVLKVKAMSSEAKASALILGSLPFIMLGLMGAVGPDYVATLFNDPRGQLMIGFALVWLLIGATVMAKMVKFEI